MHMRRIIFISTLCLLLICMLISCDGMQGLVGDMLETAEEGGVLDSLFEKVDMETVKSEINASRTEDFEETDDATDYVRIRVRDHGDIVIKLCPAAAPETVLNFKKLVHEGFYDGMVFHRIIQNFMIQGGGYDQSGAQKETDTIKGEFENNGVKNELQHVRGVISMARTTVPDSATSQFFICDATSDYLDGQYAAFGYVVAGMETVDSIAAVRTGSTDWPLEDVVIESATFVKPIKE